MQRVFVAPILWFWVRDPESWEILPKMVIFGHNFSIFEKRSKWNERELFFLSAFVFERLLSLLRHQSAGFTSFQFWDFELYFLITLSIFGRKNSQKSQKNPKIYSRLILKSYLKAKSNLVLQSNASTVDAGTVDFWNQGLKLFFDEKFLTMYFNSWL